MLYFNFYDAGAYDGETEHRIMCNFYSLRNGKHNVGQSQLVLSSEWPSYRTHIEKNGWTYRVHTYGSLPHHCTHPDYSDWDGSQPEPRG